MTQNIVIALAMLSAGDVTANEMIGAWKIEQSADPMTDNRKVMASVYSEGENAILSFICSNNGRDGQTVRFMLTTVEYLGSTVSYRGRGRREIMVRVDDNEPETMLWYYGDQSAFTPNISQVSEFGNVLRRGSDLKVRAFTYRGYQVDASFDVHGASGMIDRVKLLCRKNSR